MSTPSSNIRDNHERGAVAAYLRESIKPNDKLSFVSAYFTVPAYLALRETLDEIHSMRFLFGEPSFLGNLDAAHVQSKAFTLRDEGMSLEVQTKLRAGAMACAAWIERNNVEIRSVIRPDFLHGKLYFIERGEVQKAISGSSNFTVNGLGLKGGKGNYELNLVVDSDNDRRDLLQWFDALWNDVRTTENPQGLIEDVRERVLGYLRELYTDRSPDFVYKKTLLTLFGEQASESGEQEIQIQQTLENTAIWQALSIVFERTAAAFWPIRWVWAKPIRRWRSSNTLNSKPRRKRAFWCCVPKNWKPTGASISRRPTRNIIRLKAMRSASRCWRTPISRARVGKITAWI
jgi:hypothetical protein